MGLRRQRRAGESQAVTTAVAGREHPPDEATDAARAVRPGCVPALLRLVLVVPLLVMGAQTGQWLAALTPWDRGGAYALALVGAAVGAAVGLSLAARGVRGEGGRRLRADMALCLAALVFVARGVIGLAWPLSLADIGPVYAATLAGVTLVRLTG